MAQLPSRRRGLSLLAPMLAMVGIGAGSLSLALFTDSASTDATFTAGTISLDPTDIASMSLSTGALLPGDVLTDDVTITNDGTAELRYSASISSTNTDGLGLRSVLSLAVRQVDVTTPSTPCDDFDGAVVVASTTLDSGAAFGNAAAGADSGDRTLAAASSETLCFRVSLPLATGNAYQGATTTTTFSFSAEQTANNP